MSTEEPERINLSKFIKSNRSNKVVGNRFPSIYPSGQKNSSVPSHSVNIRDLSEPKSVILGKIVESTNSKGSL